MNTYRISAAALAAGVLLALGATSAFAGELRTSQKPIQNQYIVVLKDQAARLSAEPAAAGRARVPEVARSMAAGHGAKLLRSYEHALRGFVVQADDKALAKLLADPRVQYVEEDGYATLSATTQTGATWGLDRVDQRTLPLNGTYIYDTTATNVRAYIIDSGILTSHSQFTGRIGNGFSAIADGRGVEDCNGHGTHVAGTVGGSTWGVAKGVTLHPVRVFGCSGGSPWSTIIAGIDWVRANHMKPAVANMSLGGGGNSSVDLATENLINAGVTVVVAAGNGASDACGFSPARVAGAITVAASDSSDRRSIWTAGFQESNYGSCVDLFAPGTAITSAWWTGTNATNSINGTSMASPHVAGAAALYLANNTTASPAAVTSAILNNATLNVVSDTRGSPNRLLFTRFSSGGGGTPPTIDSMFCFFDGVTSDCSVNYTSSTPATVSWSHGQADGAYSWDVCGLNNGGGWGGYYTISVTATVSNASGSVSQTRSAGCNPSGIRY